MTSFQDMIANAKKTTAAKKNQAPKKLQEKRNLGLGRARDFESSNRKAEKAEEKFFKAQEERKASLFGESQLDKKIATLSIDHMDDDIELDESQNRALNGLMKSRFGVLIGPAGCGKTTVEGFLVRRLELEVGTVKYGDTYFATRVVENPDGSTYSERVLASEISDDKEAQEKIVSIAFAAFTGKAVENMKRALPENYHKTCSTIHALLGFYPERYENEHGAPRMKFVPAFTAQNKLPYNTYVFDEAGMIPPTLWNQFVDACPEGSRIYLIGDINQLPPVIGKSTLGFAMNKWPTFELTKIHRQAEGNPIITNAHMILNGLLPKPAKDKFDITTKLPPGESGAAEFCIKLIKKLTNEGIFDPMQDAIIVPQNKSALGQIALNEHLVTFFNPEIKENGVAINKRIRINTGTTSVLYAVGDKVMLLQNDRESGLTNGMTGFVSEINPNGKHDLKRSDIDHGDDIRGSLETIDEDEEFSLEEIAEEYLKNSTSEEDEADINQRQSSHVMTVKFSNGQEYKFSTSGDYSKCTHAYAFTCHKSQGSEYRNVLVLLHSSNARMLTREWLYTAVTRAKERVIIACNERGLMRSIRRQDIKGKNLEEKIAAFNKLANQSNYDSDEIPLLWDAEEIG